MNVKINASKVLTFFILVNIVFFVLHIFTQYLYYVQDYQIPGLRFFNLDDERSLPSLFTVFEWSSIVVLFLVISINTEGKKSYYWWGFVLLFSFLTFDEFASIHEPMAGYFRKTLNTSGLLYFAWVIPYAIGLIAILLIYSKFLLSLNRKILILFILSGAIFVSGAVLMELFEGNYVESHGFSDIYYLVFVPIEETVEMIGLSLFIYTLLLYMEMQFGNLNFIISRGRMSAANTSEKK